MVPVAVGAGWALSIPAPDLIITGDGRHLALRTDDGELALLRPRAGDYVRSTLAELSGAEPDFLELERLPGAACSADLCSIDLDRDGRRWRLLVTRTPHFVQWYPMIRACADADIVISDRFLPRGCEPRWLKADLSLLRRSGGLAIRLGPRPHVETAIGEMGSHPWAPRPPAPERPPRNRANIRQ